MGYGTRALQLLCQYYSGQLTGISVDPGSRELGQGKVYKETARELNASTSSVLREETLQVRTQLDPLLLVRVCVVFRCDLSMMSPKRVSWMCLVPHC